MINCIVVCILFFILLTIFMKQQRMEGYTDFIDRTIVQTSGMDTLVPLPFFTKYNYPLYNPQYVPPEWYYDMPTYGPIARPWGPGGRYRLNPTRY
jgi:hypothetical protein